MMNNWYKLIYETVAGSHLYGMATETSDVDYRGVALEPFESILGLQPFEQHEDTAHGDRIIYGFRKFVNLALDANPNIIELLYAPIHGDTLVYCSDIWKNVRNYREYFLSTKIAKTFVGYAYSQAKRMETHYKWMNHNVPLKPNPENFGRIFDVDKEIWTNYNLKQSYDSHLKEYQQYETWLKNRNAKRHELESKYGYDTKHGSHIVRLLQQGEELIISHDLSLPRKNFLELKAIRNGSMTYDELLQWMKEHIDSIDLLVKHSNLPDKPDYNIVHEMVMKTNYDYIRGEL